MNKLYFFKTAAISAAAFSIFSSCTIRQVQPVSRTISVSGTGVVSVAPDQASITLSVRTANKDLNTAAQENADIMDNVTKALLSAGLVNEDISTQNYNIYQDSRWENGRQIKGNYQVSNQILAIVRKIDQTGNVIDAAVKAGANELSSMEFGVSNTAPAVKQARIQAMKKAEEAAKLLAGTGGVDIGKILTIDEDFMPYNQSEKMNVPMMLTSNRENAKTAISAGKTDITVTVHVTYTLQ